MPTITPNIGLEIPDFNQANWQVPTNFNWNLLDLIFGGGVTVPALSVTTLTAGNLSGAIIANVVSETPITSVAGTIYTFSHSIALMLVLSVNGVVQRPGIDFTISGAVVTFSPAIGTTDAVFGVYFHS